jgi:uncharacterized protein
MPRFWLLQKNRAMKTQLLLVLILTSFFTTISTAQSATDSDLIKEQTFEDKTFNKKRHVSFLFTKSKNPIVRYNPISLSFGGMMYVYQKFISVQIGANCPYEISCSAFSKQCIQNYGLIKGVALSADRLMRCTRLASADLTPSNIGEDSHAIIDQIESYQNTHKLHKGQ